MCIAIQNHASFYAPTLWCYQDLASYANIKYFTILNADASGVSNIQFDSVFFINILKLKLNLVQIYYSSLNVSEKALIDLILMIFP